VQEDEAGKRFNLGVRERLCVETTAQRKWNSDVGGKQNGDWNAEVEGSGEIDFRIILRRVSKRVCFVATRRSRWGGGA
jgi:hypothetical protein